MKGPVKAIVSAFAVIVIAGGAFWGGLTYQKAKGPAAFAAAGGAQGLRGGPMADLTEEEQAQLENMTDEERQAFMEEKFGATAPGQGQGGPMRGGTLEGEVLEIADDTLTVKLDSGSQTFYTDGDTLTAYVEGAGTLAVGSNVMIIGQPSADGVTTASLVVVK